jgi:hypothetical protein
VKEKKMNTIPCQKRHFPFRINFVSSYATYLRWLRHLIERLGWENTLSIWKNTFGDYDDQFTMSILASGWQKLDSDNTNQLEAKVEALIEEFFPLSSSALSRSEVRNILEDTPPIKQIKQLFSTQTIEKESTAYDALHVRFDGLACVAEALIDSYGKQGEFILYDLVLEERLDSSQGYSGRVEDFIKNFTSEVKTPNLFTAGLEMEVISKSERESLVFMRECEWARYYKERHPRVGYLMACSTDEAAYKAFNPSLRLQRTETIMEGSDKCDFRIFAVEEEPKEE